MVEEWERDSAQNAMHRAQQVEGRGVEVILLLGACVTHSTYRASYGTTDDYHHRKEVKAF